MALSKDIKVTLPKIPESDDEDEQVEIFDVNNILKLDKLSVVDMNCLGLDSDKKTIGEFIKENEAAHQENDGYSNEKTNFSAIEEGGKYAWPSEVDKDTDSDMITNVCDRVEDIDQIELRGLPGENPVERTPKSNNSIKKTRSTILIDLTPKTEASSISTRQPVDDIWEFINSQDDVATKLAKRKEIAKREYEDHKAWCERQERAKANYIPDPEIGDFVNNEITLVSFEDSETENVDEIKTPKSLLDLQTSEQAELYYKKAAKALVSKRLELEAAKLEEERLANLEIARQRRIKARKEEAEQKKKQEEALRLQKKHDAMVKVFVMSTFPINGELFYSPTISHQEVISCLPLKNNIWESHIHLACTAANWALPVIAFSICLPEFRAIQLCQIEADPRFHLVLECTEHSKDWERIKNLIPPSNMGVKLGDLFRLTELHDAFDLSQLSLYSRAAKEKRSTCPRLLEHPTTETCVGIFRDFHNVEAVLEVLQSPTNCGAALVGLRSVYMTDLQKTVAQPMFNVLVESFEPNIPLLVVCIAGKNCRENWENFLGPMDPDLARRLEPGSIRARFGKSKEDNVIWVSRTLFKIEPKTVRAEASFFFAGRIPSKEIEVVDDATKRIVSALISLN